MRISKRLWVQILKESSFPVISGATLFILFTTYEREFKNFLNQRWQNVISGCFFTLLVMFITYWIGKVINAILDWYKANVALKTATKLDDDFIPIFRKVGQIIIWVIALIVVLSHLGININAIITTLGVSSLAIALAAQDTIANIIAGFLIMVDRPFKIGDTIRLPSGEKVKVLDIGVRRSKFLSEEGAIVIIPNVDLSKSKIVNYTYKKD